jgi:hypothetical protein
MQTARKWLGLVALAAAGCLTAAEKPKITAIERSQGWRLLFDGQSLSDWRGYRLNKVPPNWTVADGWATNSGGPGLATDEDFKDFELRFDWKVADGGTAEAYLRVDEDGATPEETGLLVELSGGTAMGGNGGLTKPWMEITPQPGLWYRAKITVYGNLVEHWVNGDRIITYMIDSPDWRAAVAGSRFKDFRGYGKLDRGRIVLTGRGASFRNVKIRPQ